MDNIHANWQDTPEVAMALELSEPGQPYSCSTWGSNFDNSEPLIVHGGSPYYHWWGMFENMYVPAHAFIDHNMKVYYKTNTLGSYTANNKIEEMLVDCGECYIDDALIEDGGTSSQSYQGFCCEEFGGTYYDDGDWNEFYCEGSDATWVRYCGNPDGDNDGFNSDIDNCPNDYNPSQSDEDNDGLGDECDDCNNMSGDLNDDMTVDILDLVSVVNVILSGGANGTECELADADMDSNGTVNILDVIQIINIVLGSARETVNGTALVSYDIIGNNDLLLKFSSDVSITGLELAFVSDYLLNIEDDNTNLYTATALDNDIQRYVAFSMENISFSDNSIEITIRDGALLDIEDIHMIISSSQGTQVPVVWDVAEIRTFELSQLQPNPFNPTTQVQYDVYKSGKMQLAVYNKLGQKITTLHEGFIGEGSHMFTWNAGGLSSGIYYVTMIMDGHAQTMKAVLVK